MRTYKLIAAQFFVYAKVQRLSAIICVICR